MTRTDCGESNKRLRLLDTFSGIGGFSYAAEHLTGGFQTVGFIERDSFCQRILNKHWPYVPIYDDISTFKPKKGSADVICGGFPCQDISLVGKQVGIEKGTRSGLFFELMRVIRAIRPRYIVLENVAAIVNNGLDTVLGEMAQAGYDTEWACIPAKELGACHKRDRWWLVAYTNSRDGEPRSLTGSAVHEQAVKQRADSDACSTDEVRGLWTATHRLDSNWKGYASEPVLCRGDDGVSNRLEHVARLKALGNAVVPQVAAIPLQRVLDLAFDARQEDWTTDKTITQEES